MSIKIDLLGSATFRLVVGDLVRVEIENIGYMENKVFLESGDSVLE